MKRWSPDELRRALELYREGLTLDEVGEALGRERGSVWAKFKKLGVKMREPYLWRNRLDSKAKQEADKQGEAFRLLAKVWR